MEIICEITRIIEKDILSESTRNPQREENNCLEITKIPERGNNKTFRMELDFFLQLFGVLSQKVFVLSGKRMYTFGSILTFGMKRMLSLP